MDIAKNLLKYMSFIESNKSLIFLLKYLNFIYIFFISKKGFLLCLKDGIFSIRLSNPTRIL